MTGKCLCGAIEFKFTPKENIAFNCFCSICRRSHGADYATQIPSSKSSLVFISGKDHLTEYKSSQYGNRAFCKTCGSRLMNYADTGISDYMSVSLSCVSANHEIKPAANFQVASKAAWVNPDQGIPSYAKFSDDIAKYM